MTILELANKLKTLYDQHGDIPVLIFGEYPLRNIYRNYVEEDGQFPGECSLSKGAKFVEIN